MLVCLLVLALIYFQFSFNKPLIVLGLNIDNDERYFDLYSDEESVIFHNGKIGVTLSCELTSIYVHFNLLLEFSVSFWALQKSSVPKLIC